MPPLEHSGANPGPEGSGRGAWRGERTRLKLIECAESLYAEQGIDGVSLRQIGIAAGSSNTNIVGYHFGTREDLINAIFEYRLTWLEVERAALYDAQAGPGDQGLESLLHAFWWPLYQQTNAQGRHSYAGFLSELLLSGHGEMRRAVKDRYPVSSRITDAMQALLPDLSGRRFEERLYVVATIITCTLRSMDQREDRGGSRKAREARFADALRMAAASLMAPSG